MKRLTESPIEEQVEELAALFFTVAEIAIFTGIEEEKLRMAITCDPDDTLSKAYFKGKLRTKIQLRFDSRNYALHGSPQAVQEMREYLANQQIDENA